MRSDPSLVRFRAVVEGALAALEARRQEVNDLNVFPVADGDTGDNMALTMRAVVEELDRLSTDGRPIDEIGRDEIVHSVARAALLGARGNSGVILSQLVRGAAEVLISRPGELVDPVLMGAAMTSAADQARKSVREPAEGTILTVVHDMAHRIVAELPHLPEDEQRLHGADSARQNALLAGVLERALQTGQESLVSGKELLPALKQAGVVDAGAYGLLIIFSGVLGVLRGEAPPELEHHAPARVSHPQHESANFRYCTNFAVTGERLDASYFVPLLEQLGDSVLVVGDELTLKVHVHTDDPARATAMFAEHGAVSHLDVADMREQVAERAERLAHGEAAQEQGCGVLAVCAGEGVADLYRSLGAVPLPGGPTLNPSTYELLAGIHSVPAEEVVVLPNSPNVIMAAERAAELSDKVVRVVPTTSQQAGLVAALALDPAKPAAANADAMAGALAGLRTGAVAEAARDDGEARFRAGDAVGFVEGELIAWGKPEETLARVLAEIGQDAELLTLIEGDGAPLDGGSVTRLAPDGVEVEISHGGQPAYWWLIAAE